MATKLVYLAPAGAGTLDNLADFSVPPIVAQGESSVIRIILFGSGSTLAGSYYFYIISPDGQSKEVSTSFRAVTPTGPAPYLEVFEMPYTFQQAGHYTFSLNERLGTGHIWIDKTFAAPWATRIDIPVSDLKRQRTDIERVYNRVNR